MFGFSKKKEDSQSQQAAPQTSKIEDDNATFEIPDFSDDDLNFDLGIGEFVPLDTADGSPKGLPTAPSEVPKPDEIPPMPFHPGTQAVQAKPLIDVKTKVSQPDSFPALGKIAEHEAQPQIEEEPDEEDLTVLPKFSTQGEVNLADDVRVAPEKHEKKQKYAAKKTLPKIHIDKNEPKHYAQAGPEGFFVPKDVYKKIILLSDDILKQLSSGDESVRAMHAISKQNKDIITDADREAKSIRDMMMSADSMLFGGN